MVFPTASENARPIRLSARMRRWANESMNGRYGSEARQTPFVKIENENFEKMDDLDKYDHMISEIARKAPLRICKEELVSGSATLGAAIDHLVPAFYQDKSVFRSVSHLTINYDTALRYGIECYEKQIAEKLEESGLDHRQRRFLRSLQNVIEALRIYHGRYLQAVKAVKPEIYKNLQQVPFRPARNFYEAVQCIWFIFSFVRLCGNWPGIGRLDLLLGDYLKKDLASGVQTIRSAREILASFFIKGTEWIEKDTVPSSGDAQHYQNIVLAGTDEDGNETANEVTYLVLDIIEELGISDFPVTVRISEKTGGKLLGKVARVIRHGGGIVAVYNEPTVLNALKKCGYSQKEAQNFANDGCWEVQIPGRTQFMYIPFDSLALLQRETLKNYTRDDFADFDQIFAAYIEDLNRQIANIFETCMLGLEDASSAGRARRWKPAPPASVVSLFEDDCIGNAASYYEGGTIYTVFSPHIGGIADTVNSLYAIKKLVFDDKKISLKELFSALRDDWKGHEPLRQAARSYRYYGTDNDEVDALYADILHKFHLACEALNDRPEFKFVAGVSTFGREIAWLPNRLATPEGYPAGMILAGNASPTPGTDTEGATAVIRSYAKADLSEMTSGTALDLKISPETLKGTDGVAALKALIRGFARSGGYFVQIDTVSAETLKLAQQDPQTYKTLSVRVSGWNARFVTLTKEWQDMIIQRTEYHG